MSGPAIGRASLETEEAAKTEEVARLAQTVELLEQRLEQERTALAQAVGGLTTLRKVLGAPMSAPAAPEPNGSSPAKRRSSKKKS